MRKLAIDHFIDQAKVMVQIGEKDKTITVETLLMVLEAIRTDIGLIDVKKNGQCSRDTKEDWWRGTGFIE